jgi:uncharacterized protein (DUF1697 family)
MTYIGLLRGVNLGPTRKLLMADLRAMLVDMGLGDPRTLLQSGNVVFTSDSRSPASLERRLDLETAARFKLQTIYYLRTPAEWAAMVRANPFKVEAERDPARLHLACFREPVTAAKVNALQAVIPGREVVHGSGRALYFFYPDGMGQSKLTPTLIDRVFGQKGTMRNWNTVRKLHDLAGA